VTQDEIIEMARQAGARQMVSSLTHPKGPVTALKFDLDSDSLQAFAKLVAEREREACAKVCEEHGKVWAERFLLGYQATLNDAADAIRARGEA